MTMCLHRCARSLTPQAAPKVVTNAVNLYKHWKPLDSAKHDNQTQQDIDAALQPYHLPYMVENPEHHLQLRSLGKTKCMTFRAHALCIERTLKISKDIIRWEEGEHANSRVHDLLDQVLEAKCRISRLQNIWNTLN